jgi:hypothetical protein
VLTTAVEQLSFLFQFAGTTAAPVKKFQLNMWENLRLTKVLAVPAGGRGGGRGR